MHHTRGVLIRNFGRLQDPGLDALRLEILYAGPWTDVPRFSEYGATMKATGNFCSVAKYYTVPLVHLGERK